MISTNFKLLFDLNIQLRYGAQWDPTNTANFLGYVDKMKYHDVFNFELGNGKTIELFSNAVIRIRWKMFWNNCFNTWHSLRSYPLERSVCILKLRRWTKLSVPLMRHLWKLKWTWTSVHRTWWIPQKRSSIDVERNSDWQRFYHFTQSALSVQLCKLYICWTRFRQRWICDRHQSI